MLYYFIGGLLIALGITFFIIETAMNLCSFWAPISGLVCVLFGLLIVIGGACTQAEFKTFEREFEITREYAEAVLKEDIDQSERVYVVMDLLNANKQLAMYKAQYETWGMWSNIPARVQDINPIGVK